MATRFKIALNRFRTREEPTLRGRYFVRLAMLIERQMEYHDVSLQQIVDWCGAPDLHRHSERDAAYVYRFDHVKSSKRRDEWYFFFREGILTTSGFNRAGINQFPDFQTEATFPALNHEQQHR